MADPNTANAAVFLRPLASPLSLGFLGLFYATTALAAVQLGWVPAGQMHTIAVGMLVFTVPVQLIACVYGFLSRDLVCATGMGVEAGIWAAVAASLLRSAPGTTSAGLALILVLGAIAVCMPAIGATNSKLLATLVLFTTAARWGTTAGYQASADDPWKTAAGALGLLLACLALYASLAFELEDQHRRSVLPTLRRGGATAMTGTFGEQIDQIQHEAGVRKHL